MVQLGDDDRTEVHASERANYGRDIESVQTATDQNASDAQNEFVVGNAPEVSFSTTITGACWKFTTA